MNLKNQSKEMEVISRSGKRTDTTLLAVAHLTQLLGYIIGFGSLIVPLVIWLSTRDKVEGMNEHGKAIVNFQLTLLLIIFVSIPAIFFFGLGILSLILALLIGFIVPIVNAVKAGNGESPSYFCTIRFIA